MSVSVELCKLKAGILVESPLDVPLACEYQQIVALDVLNKLSVRSEYQLLKLVKTAFKVLLAGYPTDMLVWKSLADDVNVVLVFETVLKDLKLQYADNAYDNFLEAALRLGEYLDRTFLRDLGRTLYELLALKRVLLADTREMLRRKGRDAFELNLFLRGAYRVSDGENTRIEHAHDIAGISFGNDLALARHHLLRLGKAHCSAILNVKDFHVLFELATADTHESDTVAVSLVHISLYLENKCGELRVERVNNTVWSAAGQGRCRHFEEVLEERLNAEVSERGTEEYRRELTLTDEIHVEFFACAVE